ncbi:MAG: TnpV protein, partial [Eubacteriales bacterium]|nr:TnpV protein [Eubacteriales bacterium]
EPPYTERYVRWCGRSEPYGLLLPDYSHIRFFRLVEELTQKEGITEKLKTEDQMLWVQRMNAIREAAKKIVNKDLIYA